MIKSYSNFILENRYHDFINKLEKDDEKYNVESYDKVQKLIIKLLKQFINKSLSDIESTWAGTSWYGEVSNKLKTKDWLNNIIVHTSKNSVWAIEIEVTNISDDTIRNIIIDHILEKISDIEETVNKFFNINNGVAYKDFHLFDYDSGNTIVITNDKLNELILRIKDTPELKDKTDDIIIEYLNKITNK